MASTSGALGKRGNRDEFPKPVRDAVAKRAHYICSNPFCLKFTAGPHSSSDKALLTGIAAHMNAAAPGGPRYDAQQGPGRRDASNAIWLCHDCSDLVDKDEIQYPTALLRQWKADHESMIAEVRVKGYSDSLRLIQARAEEPAAAHRLLALLEDRRVLWVALDAEFPARVRFSLDLLRSQISKLRGELGVQSELYDMLGGLQRIILAFFDRVERFDLDTLLCEAGNDDWSSFRESLAAFRKAFGLQLSTIVSAYNLRVSENLEGMFPASAT